MGLCSPGMCQLPRLYSAQQGINLANYGKEFINVDKLFELNSIMKSDSADTIAQALAVYNNRH